MKYPTRRTLEEAENECDENSVCPDCSEYMHDCFCDEILDDNEDFW